MESCVAVDCNCSVEYVHTLSCSHGLCLDTIADCQGQTCLSLSAWCHLFSISAVYSVTVCWLGDLVYKVFPFSFRWLVMEFLV